MPPSCAKKRFEDPSKQCVLQDKSQDVREAGVVGGGESPEEAGVCASVLSDSPHSLGV